MWSRRSAVLHGDAQGLKPIERWQELVAIFAEYSSIKGSVQAGKVAIQVAGITVEVLCLF